MVMECKVTARKSHYPKDVPFLLPKGWDWSTLGEFFNLQAGKFISAEDIHTESVHYPYRCYGGNGIRGYVSTFNRNGDYPVIGRQGALCGNVNYASGEFYATEHAVVVETFCGTDSLWAKYLLEQLNLNQYATATAQPGLSVKTINEVAIPIPPVGEQHRISDALTRCFGIINDVRLSCEDLRVSVAQTKSRVLDLAIHGKLVPQDPSEEPAINLLRRINPGFQPSHNLHYEGQLPNGWTVVSMESFCTTINGLWKGDKEPLINVGVIRNANFTKDFSLDYSKIEYINVEERSFSKRNLEDGDIIVEKSGGSDNFPVGRSILYRGESGKYSFSNFTMSLRIKDKSHIIPEYLFYALQSMYRRGDMRQMQTQTTGLHNLLTDVFMSAQIPIPPLNEQKRIVTAIENHFQTLDSVRSLLQD